MGVLAAREAARMTNRSTQPCIRCERPAHARGLCATHYRDWLSSAEGVQRSISGPYRAPHRVKFTPQLWHKWLARQIPTEHSKHLSAGIQLFRGRLK